MDNNGDYVPAGLATPSTVIIHGGVGLTEPLSAGSMVEAIVHGHAAGQL